MKERISTFFSHSYWPEDREVNKYFWRLFWEAGFTFTVDPRSGRLSIPRIELLVRRSATFAAVVTYRSEVNQYLTSPYIVFEYGLAVQADKPRLTFIDRRVARNHYEETRRLVFDRDALTEDRDRHVAAINQLYDQSVGHVPSGDRKRGTVGLVLPPDGAYGSAMTQIRAVLDGAGYEVDMIHHETPNPYRFIVDVDRHDFIVVDVGDSQMPSWLHPVLHGRLVPMIRLVHYERRPGRARSLPRLALGHAIDTVARSDELAIWWSSVDELILNLEREVRSLRLPSRGELRTLDQGNGYFNSLGRSIDARVFVSNANRENDLAQELCMELTANYVQFSHSIFDNTSELGGSWSHGLRERLRSSQLFVALLTSAYWESDVCREEFRVAEELCRQGRLRIFPYLLEPGGEPVAHQGRALHRLPPDQWLDRIVLDIDGYLKPRSVAPEVSQRWWRDETEPQVDIAIVTILLEEYDAVRNHLDWSEPAPPTEARPNRCEWRLGEISPTGGGRPYRVVLGLAGASGTAGQLTVAHTIEAFRPRHVLLVGVAGGLGGPEEGDVVVADRVYGYAYGANEGGFHPRPDWVFPIDAAIVNAAHVMSRRHPDWSAGLNESTGTRTAPRIFVGPIASGNQAVEDIEDPAFLPVAERWPDLRAVEMDGIGAAEMIKNVREGGHVVNFGMVRGIASGRHRSMVRAAEAAAALATQMIRRAWSRPPHA